MIKYTNISYEEYFNLSEEERKKPYCIKHSNGNVNWRVNDLFHREDGPAMTWSDGSICWCLNDKSYTFEGWLKLTPISDEEKVFLKLKYT